MLLPTQLHKLLVIAKQLRAKTRAEAHGHCLGSTLELCVAAEKTGIDTKIVVWNVSNDPDFFDHWAVAIGSSKVIDVTRAQIDCRKELIFDLSDYPNNFTSYRIYPSSQFLDKYKKFSNTSGNRLSPRVMFSLHGLVMKHDLMHGLRHRNIKLIARCALVFGRFGLAFFLQHGLSKLRARRNLLSHRLH